MSEVTKKEITASMKKIEDKVSDRTTKLTEKLEQLRILISFSQSDIFKRRRK